MWPYWLMFLVPALFAIQERANVYRGLAAGRGVRTGISPAWYINWLLLTLLIGFREHVGGDWGSYIRYIYSASTVEFSEVLLQKDPGYFLLNWISSELDFSIYGVNVAGGAIFAFGLVCFCLAQPRPWLALAVSIPYIVIVVAMGYSRQGIAIGLGMLAFNAIGKAQIVNYLIYTSLAATFHRTAVVLIGIPIVISKRKLIWKLVLLLPVTYMLYGALLGGEADTLYKNYVEAKLVSDGAQIRSVMNLIPALIFLWWGKRFGLEDEYRKFWVVVSILAIGLFAAVLLTTASTVPDRLGLYLLPLQAFVFSRFPDIAATSSNAGPSSSVRGALAQKGAAGRPGGAAWVALILVGYAAALFTWLVFGNFSFAWLPYRSYLLE